VISIPLDTWRQHVERQQHWHVHQHDGYSAKAVDVTAYWRPACKGCKTKHYHPQAGKALPAVTIGVIGRVGSVNGQRVAVLTDLVRSDPEDASETALQSNLLKQVTDTLDDDEMPVFDAGFKVRQLQMFQLPRWVVRLAKNFTARRNRPVPYQGKGRRPEYGEKVRPLARVYKGHRVAATAPDRGETWVEDSMVLQAEFWDDLVLPDVKASPGAEAFYVAAIHDLRFKEPWLLASPIKLTGPALRGLYRDRWPIEQVPLTAKQMIGGARQFVLHQKAVNACLN
jgi:hypothetical protein